MSNYKHFLQLHCKVCDCVYNIAGVKPISITRTCVAIIHDGFLCAGQLEETKVGPSVLRAFARRMDGSR